MVQYIHTPWRDRAELLQVRRQFYPSIPAGATATTVPAIITIPPSSSSRVGTITTSGGGGDDDGDDMDDEAQRQRQHAVARVAMWVQRGSCPHMVESTGLLTAAMLDDLRETSRMGLNSSTSAIRLAYSAAFSRFVTGLLDSHQDKQQKQSMYSIAKTIDLPATFVELRHQCTHEQLPSLLKLREAAQKSLVWIWNYYWKHLPEVKAADDGTVRCSGAIRESLLSYLTTEEAEKKSSLEKLLSQWDEADILQGLAEIGESVEDPRILLQSLQLSREIMDGRTGLSHTLETKSSQGLQGNDMEAIHKDIDHAKAELETMESKGDVEEGKSINEQRSQAQGWSRYEGTWKPKPIGI
ncbi:Las1-like-domain-containing protein, partial [Xylariales sp. PMI_506]